MFRADCVGKGSVLISLIFDFWLIFQLQSPTQGEINYCIVFGHWGKWDESKQRADFENKGENCIERRESLVKETLYFLIWIYAFVSNDSILSQLLFKKNAAGNLNIPNSLW